MSVFNLYMERIRRLLGGIRHYVWNLVVALDQLLNTLLGGWPDMTFSARAYIWHRDGKSRLPAWLIDHVLFPWRSSHCYESYISERERNQLPPEFRVSEEEEGVRWRL